MTNYKELLIGSGSSRIKRMSVNEQVEWTDLLTLDWLMAVELIPEIG